MNGLCVSYAYKQSLMWNLFVANHVLLLLQGLHHLKYRKAWNIMASIPSSGSLVATHDYYRSEYFQPEKLRVSLLTLRPNVSTFLWSLSSWLYSSAHSSQRLQLLQRGLTNPRRQVARAPLKLYSLLPQLVSSAWGAWGIIVDSKTQHLYLPLVIVGFIVEPIVANL